MDAPTDPTRPRVLLCALILVIVVIGVFSAVPGFDFMDWDDQENVSQNPYYFPVSARSIAHFWSAAYNSLYMPVTYSLWGLAALAGTSDSPVPRPDGGANALDPAPFHALSVLFHAGCSLPTFFLIRYLLRRTAPDVSEGRRLGAALFGAGVFAAHPLQVESVAWVTGFNNLSAGLFGLAALLIYLPVGDGPRTGFPVRRYGASVVVFALALLAKPTAAAVPLIAAFLEIVVLRRPWRESLTRLTPWVLMTAAMAAATLSASRSVNSGIYLPIWGRPFVCLDALGFYAAKLIAPVNLGVDYGRTPKLVLTSPATYIIAAAVVLGAVLLTRWRIRGVAQGLAVFVLATLPMLGVVPYYFQHHSTVADRYVYLGMFGIGFALASAMVAAEGHLRRYALPFGTIAVASLAATAYLQTMHWRSTTALFTQALAVNRRSHAAYNNLGSALDRQGRTDEANRMYRRALELNPSYSEALYNLGSNLGRNGNYREALPLLQAAARYDPRHAPTLNNLGMAWEKLGDRENAIAAYDAALRVAPDFTPSRNNRARLRKGKP